MADSRIAPDSGAIVIRRKAKIDPLENAVIRTNDITKYYSIYDADVEIFTKHDYLASGIYDYLDLNGDKQNIFFSEIKPDANCLAVSTKAFCSMVKSELKFRSINLL